MSWENWHKTLTSFASAAGKQQMRRDFMADISHELRAAGGIARRMEAIQDGVRQFT